MLGICIREFWGGPERGTIFRGQELDVDPASPEAVCFDFTGSASALKLAEIRREELRERVRVLAEIHEQKERPREPNEELSPLDEWARGAHKRPDYGF